MDSGVPGSSEDLSLGLVVVEVSLVVQLGIFHTHLGPAEAVTNWGVSRSVPGSINH